MNFAYIQEFFDLCTIHTPPLFRSRLFNCSQLRSMGDWASPSFALKLQNPLRLDMLNL